MLFFKSKPITQITGYAVSNIGKQRQNNEDNFAINGQFMNEDIVEQCVDGKDVCVSGGTLGTDSLPVFAVCDGMGGEALGEVASQTAAAQFAGLFGKNSPDMDALVDKTVTKTNDLILQQAEQQGRFRIGTTLALAYIQNGILKVVNVGDSRVYLLRGNKLRQLSYDHTELQYYVAAKLVTSEEARNHPMRHGLTQHLGMDSRGLQPYRAKDIKLAVGDKLLLCSDGITEMLEDSELMSLLAGSQNAESAAKTIVSKAVENGGVDNSTAIAVFIE